MKLRDTKAEYKSNLVSKTEYIKKMHKIHEVLFDYAEFLNETAISKIEIEYNNVIMTTKNSNIRIYCDKEDLRIIPIEILNFGSYEENELEMILKLIQPNNNVFDIGGNIGWVSMNISRCIPNVNIYTFEPIPKTFKYLSKNIKLNNFSNIYINNFGFSNEEKELIFYYYPEGSGNASMLNLSENPNVEKTVCSVKKLDDYVFSNNLVVDFIKCDVEGAELFVFQGGLEVLKKYKPIVFTEMLRKWALKFNYHPNEIISMYKEIGYKCYTINGHALTEIITMDDNTIETNFFFLNIEKHIDIIMKYTTK